MSGKRGRDQQGDVQAIVVNKISEDWQDRNGYRSWRTKSSIDVAGKVDRLGEDPCFDYG
jgi:hypothetical protein